MRQEIRKIPKQHACSNFLHSLSGQSTGGGASGQKTKSASAAKAPTIARYLSNK